MLVGLLWVGCVVEGVVVWFLGLVRYCLFFGGVVGWLGWVVVGGVVCGLKIVVFIFGGLL